jgi:hypothetical protein
MCRRRPERAHGCKREIRPLPNAQLEALGMSILLRVVSCRAMRISRRVQPLEQAYNLVKSSGGEVGMPDESRVVSFSNAEVIEAIVDYCNMSKRDLPAGGIKGLSFSNVKEIKVTVQPDGQVPAFSLFENEIAVALILLCNKKGIPVARRALKSLQVAQDAVSLHLMIRN